MLADVLLATKARLTAAGVTTPFLIGKQFVKQHGEGGNRLVVVPNEDSFGAGTTQDFNGLGRQKPLLTRTAGAEVHVWGVAPDRKADTASADAMRAAEVLLHLFIRELRAVVRGQWKAASGRWNNDVADNVFGAEYVLQITVDIPVVAAQLQALPAGAIDTTFTIGNTSEAG